MSRRRGAPPPAEALFVVNVGNLDRRAGHRRDCEQVALSVFVWATSEQQARNRCAGLSFNHAGAGSCGDDLPEYVSHVEVLTSEDVGAFIVAPVWDGLNEKRGGDR